MGVFREDGSYVGNAAGLSDLSQLGRPVGPPRARTGLDLSGSSLDLSSSAGNLSSTVTSSAESSVYAAPGRDRSGSRDRYSKKKLGRVEDIRPSSPRVIRLLPSLSRDRRRARRRHRPGGWRGWCRVRG